MSASNLAAPLLISGMKMSREEFMRRWDASPDIKHAELIDGEVYVASPVSVDHSLLDGFAGFWLHTYAAAASTCIVGHSETWLMLESSPQPDLSLYFKPEYGGKFALRNNYRQGTPDLVVEVCVTSTEYDFGPKLALYQRAGVSEYITLEQLHSRITWRVLRDGSYQPLKPADDGIYRSEVFPGLWLDASAIWHGDYRRIREVVDSGVAAGR
ncbi:MAG: Uma2 family endonuclease [Bryobacterales bacterium]|nr:Uma2 family endonuclease [Bryobacterales bacterium]